MLHDLLFARATTHPGLAALIGVRFYPMILPQSAVLPAVTTQQISNPSSRGTARAAAPRVQFNVWARSYVEAKAVATQIKLAFEGYTYDDGSTVIKGMRRVNELDLYESNSQRYRVLVDMVVHTLD